MVKANPFGEYQDYFNKIPQHLRENPEVVIIGEKLTPIVLEEELDFDFAGVHKISYGLSESLRTPFNNLELYVAPKNGLINIKELAEFKAEVLTREFSHYSPGASNGIKINNEKIEFPRAVYFEDVGSLSVLCPKYDVILKDLKEQNIISKTSVDVSEKPYGCEYRINASIGVFFYPSTEIAKAIVDGTLKWHNEPFDHGYLREELGKYDIRLGPPSRIERIENWIKKGL